MSGHETPDGVRVIPCEVVQPTTSWMPVSFNDEVRVRLTDIGRQEYARRIRELNQRLPIGRGYSEQPAIDDQGYHRTQLWSLAQDYGHLCGLGMRLPFETNVLLRRAVLGAQP